MAMAWREPGEHAMQGSALGRMAKGHATSTDETLAKLQKLGELWLSGVITTTEFDEQKASILAHES